MSAARHRQAIERLGRPGVLFLSGISLGALAIVSVSTTSSSPAAPEPGPAGVVASPSAESSSWTCGGMTDGSDSVAAGTVILTNSTRQERTATVTVIDDAGHTAQDKVTIGALATSTVGVSNQLSGGTWLMAQVLVDGGGVLASEQIAGSQGRTLSDCGSRTSSTWQFTGGSTQRGQALTISLANPTATPAVANVSFITANAGAATPQGSQGLVVGPHAVVAVPVQNLVAHGADLASDVTVTQGRLVAFATQVSTSPVGVGVALGQAELEATWVLARQVASPGATITIDMANPTSASQVVVVRARIPSGWLAPWRQVVDPYTVWSLQISPTSRVPSTDVVAVKVRASGPGVSAFATTQVAGASSGGWGSTPLQALPKGPSTVLVPKVPGLDRDGITVFNPGASPITVLGEALNPLGSATIRQLTQVIIPAGGIVSVGPSVLSHMAGQALTVSGSGPLAVGETITGSAVPGVAILQGIPTS